MKKLFLIAAALLSIAATTQGQETFNIVDLDDELEVCDFITHVMIEKDPAYQDTPFWIDINDNVIHRDYIVIDMNNNVNGNITYIESNNCTMKCVHISTKENNMPAPRQDTAWLHEDLMYNVQHVTLKPTEEDLGYLYIWESDNWPQGNQYQGYELTTGSAGIYTCHMYDECNNHSTVEYLVEKAPVIERVTTNLNLNLNELHWSERGTTYDTIAIFRNESLITIDLNSTEVWVDPVFNNEGGTPWYVMYAVQNGRIIPASASRWMTGISLEAQNETTETIEFDFYGLDNEMAYPLEGYVQYYKLYSVETNELNIVQNEIPVGTTHLTGIANEHSSWMIAARLWNGVEIYSNIVYSSGTMNSNEKNQHDFQIYPNPTTGILNFSEFINSEFKVFDIQGRTVMCGKVEQHLDVSSLTKGLYTIEINNGKQLFTKEFIRE